MIHALRQLLDAGSARTPSITLQRKVRQTNLGALLGQLVILLFCAFYLFIGSEVLLWTGIVQIPTFFAFFVVPWLNHRGHPLLAVMTLLHLCTADVLLIMAAGQGTVLGVERYLLVMALMVAMLVPHGRWRWTVATMVENAALYLWLQLHPWPPSPAMQALPEPLVHALYEGMGLSCLITAFTVMIVSELAAVSNEVRLEALAGTDELTGLPNRRYGLELLRAREGEASRAGVPFTVAVFDVDWFKRVNDTLGHAVGDEVLAGVATTLAQASRQGDLVARLGGEEFLVLLPGTPVSEAIGVAERLRAAIEAAPLHGIHVTVSAGLAEWRPGAPPGATLGAADAALYQAKDAGRNCIRVSSESAPGASTPGG